jgi:hypothetical protein
MLKFRSPVVLQLQDGELLPLDGLWLSVVRGRVWITQAGDPDDHFLDAGQSMRLPRGARALLSAEGPAQIALAAHTYTPQPRRAHEAAQWLLSFLRPRAPWTYPPTS